MSAGSRFIEVAVTLISYAASSRSLTASLNQAVLVGRQDFKAYITVGRGVLEVLGPAFVFLLFTISNGNFCLVIINSRNSA